MGSRVIRGNLLVVPIGHSILYVSPLYLRAAAGQLPELKRVIAAYGDRVVMEETLAPHLRQYSRRPRRLQRCCRLLHRGRQPPSSPPLPPTRAAARRSPITPARSSG